MSTSFLYTHKYRVRMSQSVMFNVLQHHIIRDQLYEYAYGPLFGTFSAGIYDVKHCSLFPYPEKSKDKTIIKKELLDNIISLTENATNNDYLIGWFITGGPYQYMSDSATDIHTYFLSKLANPVLINIDTSLREPTIKSSAYLTQPLKLGQMSLGLRYNTLEISYTSDDIDLTMIELFDQSLNTNIPTTSITDHINTLNNTLRLLLDYLNKAKSYVTKVVNKEIKGDIEIGKDILDAINSIPRMSVNTFKSSFQSALQDLLLILYITQVTKIQVSVAQKLISIPL